MKKMKLFTAAAAVMLSSFVLLFISIAARTSIIINMGIKIHRMVVIIFVVGFISGVVSLAVLIVLAVRRMKTSHGSPMHSVAEEKPMTEHDRNNLYARLKEFRTDKWRNVKGIKELYVQLDDMNEYQENLGFLLSQTAYLKEQPAVIIQRVEDAMYVNIKKLINYMQVLQRKDEAVMKQKVEECSEKNAELLQKAKDFVVAVVDYVNKDMSPGEDQKAVDHVNSYMYVVLDAIEKEEFYLS